jgi:hypothetical protein
MSESGDLSILLRAGRKLEALCRQAEAVVGETQGLENPAVRTAAREMQAQLRRTKHALEIQLVAWVLDCQSCGRRVHWVVGEDCELGHWEHAEPAPDHEPVT